MIYPCIKRSKESIYLLFMLLLFSCTKDDSSGSEQNPEQDREQIEFNTDKLDLSRTAEQSTISDFSVFGYYTGKNSLYQTMLDGGFWESNWMYNQKVLRQTDGSYSYSPISYWPLDAEDKISFLAYSPSVDAQNTDAQSPAPNLSIISPDAEGTEKELIFDYTLNSDNPREDFLVSFIEADRTRNSSPIQFYMKHALSKLTFTIRSTVPGITLESVSLGNLFTNALFKSFSRSWEGHNSVGNLIRYDTESMPLTQEPQTLNEYYIVLPQSFSTTTPIFTFVFTNNGETKTQTFSPTKEWVEGNSYNYNIAFTSDDILVQTSVEAWIEKTVQEDIVANQYINLSTRQLFLTGYNYLYYNSSFPSTSISPIAHYKAGFSNTEFNFNDYFAATFEYGKISIAAINDQFVQDEFIFYILGNDLNGNALTSIPINVKIIKASDLNEVEVNGVIWAPGNIIIQSGMLDIAPNPTYSGVYFKGGSLIGATGNNNGEYTFDINKNLAFIPEEFAGNISSWAGVPYEEDLATNDDVFSDAYGGIGFDAEVGKGDPCRYMSSQKGWTKGEWRMPRESDYSALAQESRERIAYGSFQEHFPNEGRPTSTNGTQPITSGMFIKGDNAETETPSEDDLMPNIPPKGWLFLPASGQRYKNGNIQTVNGIGVYWTSTSRYATTLQYIYFNNSKVININWLNVDAAALTIRCVKDAVPPKRNKDED